MVKDNVNDRTPPRELGAASKSNMIINPDSIALQGITTMVNNIQEFMFNMKSVIHSWAKAQPKTQQSGWTITLSASWPLNESPALSAAFQLNGTVTAIA